MNESVSIVVCTYRRPKELEHCLQMLCRQMRRPNEIIVVDNDPAESAKAAVEHLTTNNLQSEISIQYRKNSSNSLTSARNLGVHASQGSIICFIDDDVEVELTYLSAILDIFKTNPAVRGVQGFMRGLHPNRLGNFIHRLFNEFHYSQNASVLSSFSATYPLNCTQVQECQWLSGSNHCYRRSVFEELTFDETLLKYSEGEDLDFSYRVYKKFPGSLRITPAALVTHVPSPQGRLATRELVYMREVYGLYLFYKHFGGSTRACITYIWNRIGRMLISLLQFTRSLNLDFIREMVTLFQAYHYCYSNRARIAAGDLREFNKLIVENKLL